MLLPVGSLDLLNLLFLPLAVTTAIGVKREWNAIWDQDLTNSDRYWLKRLVMFCLLPVVVFFHEMGHVCAIKLFGGQVKEFHYAFMWGYVVPFGHFSDWQLVWLYFAGNLVQIVIGLMSGAAAMLVTAPAAVALFSYLALWSVGGTVLIYALLSVSGLYGDWIAIYSAPVPGLVASIACFHGALIMLTLWGMYGAGPRVWFLQRTNPDWAASYRERLMLARTMPSPQNWVELGWSYHAAELGRQAAGCLRLAFGQSPGCPEGLLLEAALHLTKGRPGEAIKSLLKIVGQDRVNDRLRARALIAAANCAVKTNQTDQALIWYDQANLADPSLADGHFYKAMLLGSLQRPQEAREELLASAHLDWYDASLKAAACQPPNY